jgi:signal transduction histidine kinase
VTIKSRLQIITLSTALVFATLVGVNAWSQRQFRTLEDQTALVVELNHTIFQRVQVRDEYFMYRNARALEQWTLLHQKVDGILQRLPLALTGADEIDVIRHMRSDQRRIGNLFAELTAADARDDRSLPQAAELRERIVTQLMSSAHDLYLDGLRLTAIMNAKMARYRRRSLVVGNASLLLLGFIIIGTSVIIERSITRPIEKFEEGVEIVSRGNLDHKIGLATRDEIGRLSRSFDEMTMKLQKITVSRDELAGEINRRKEAEAALHKSNEELERSNKDLEQFAYVASHDLQEPLRMVSSYTQLLAKRYEGQLDDKARKFIGYAVDGALRMQRLINDLLTYSRIGTEGKPRAAVDAHAIVGEALRNLAAAIEESGAVVSTENLPIVRADASQLAMVFQNLIGNAIKFRGPEEPRVHVGVADRAGEWVFSVRDNGIGIDPQYADRLFVIFQRLHTRQQYPGTGIGLAVCKRIVERHGGRVWFESEPGSGSTFFFSIPK